MPDNRNYRYDYNDYNYTSNVLVDTMFMNVSCTYNNRLIRTHNLRMIKYSNRYLPINVTMATNLSVTYLHAIIPTSFVIITCIKLITD